MKSAVAIAVALCFAAPSVFSQAVVQMYADRDNTLYQSSSGALSNGIGTAFFCGVTANGLKRRGLIHFDIAGNVPAGATILAATVTLEMNQTAAGPLTINLFRLNADWGEGTSFPATGNGGSGSPATTNDATWLHRFYPSVFWSTPGGDFSASASASASVWLGGFYNWSSSLLAIDVQNMLNSPATNFGWMLKSPETLVGDAKRFTSREEVVPQGWPRLTVTYTAPPAASVTNLGFGCSALFLNGIGQPTLGNSSFAFSASGAPPGSAAYVIPSSALAGSPLSLGGGCFFDLDIASSLALIDGGYSLGPITVNGAGGAVFAAPIPPAGGLHGLSAVFQCVVVGATVSSSNVLSLVLGS